MKKILITVLLIVFSAGLINTQAQQDTTSTKKAQKELKKAQKAEHKTKKIEEGKFLISPILLPGYTPELQFAIGGGGIMSWRNSKTDKSLPRSNMPVNLTFSSTGAMVVNLRPTTYWASDNFRLNGDVWYKDMPDNYWGIGYQNAFETPKSDSTTAYNRE